MKPCRSKYLAPAVFINDISQASSIKSKLSPIFIAYTAVTRTTSPQSEWLSLKKFYLHPKFGSWSLLKLFSIYAHSSIEASLKKSSWNSSHNQLNQLHGLTLTELTRNLQQLQQNTFSLQKGPYWSFKQTNQGNNNFSALSRGGFLAALEEVLKFFTNVFLFNSRDGVCLCPTWFSQPIVLPG